MSIIYVSGLSGSGKSTFAKLLAEKLNYDYLSVDSIAHDLYNKECVLKKVKELFGNAVFDENGTFNRKKLGKIFFENKNSEVVKEYEDFTFSVAKSEIEEKIKGNVVVDWILTPTTFLWQLNAIRILVKPISNDLRYQKIMERDNVSLDYIISRDKAAPNFVESEFDFVIENDYSEGGLNSKVEETASKINDRVTLRVLGESSPYALSEGACPSYLVTNKNCQLLLDCGSGSHRNYDFKNLNGLNIIISHLHKDHFNDVFNYQYAALVKNNHKEMNKSVNIYLPDYDSDIAKIILDEQSEYCTCYEINSNTKLTIEDFSLEFIKVEHSTSLTSYAVKITKGGLKIVYTGDLSYSNYEKISSFASGADLLVIESSLLVSHGFSEICSHLTAKQAGKIAKKANVKKVLLTHFWPHEDRNNYLVEAKSEFNNVIIASMNKEIYLFD